MAGKDERRSVWADLADDLRACGPLVAVAVLWVALALVAPELLGALAALGRWAGG